MTTPLIIEMLHAERTRQLREEAATARRVAVLLCCRPGARARAGRRLSAALRAVADRRGPSGSGACCAPA